MLQADVIHPGKLSAQDRAAWLGICDAVPEFRSPLLGPDFAEAVGAVRADAAVAIFRRKGRTIGFLPHHRGLTGMARPIGSPFSDYHALVSESGTDVSGGNALAAAGLAGFRYSAMVDPNGIFQAGRDSEEQSFTIELNGGAPDYVETIRSRSPKRFKNLRRLDHKLERERGGVSFVAPDPSQAAFDRLLAWKRDQLRRTGRHDFLGSAWTSRLMQGFFATREGALTGMLLTLRVDDQPVAGQFGVRMGDRFHPWIAAFDPAFSEWSIGQIFFLRAIVTMPALGLSIYDLGLGHEQYKRPFSVASTRVAGGVAFSPTLSGRAARSWNEALALAGRALGSRSEVLTSARRRFAQITAVETSLSGRLKGIMDATAAITRHRAGIALPLAVTCTTCF